MTKQPPAHRQAEIDAVKGLGIVLVVMGHGWLAQHDKGALFKVIFSFHIPLFFFLSGVLLKGDAAPLGFVLSRARGLLQPYLAVLLCLGAWRGLSEWMATRQVPASSWAYVQDVLYGTGRTLPPEWASMWFLPHLFVVSCVAYAVIRLCPREWLLWPLSAGALAAGVFSLDVARDLPWSLDLLPLSLPFVLLGHLCRNLCHGYLCGHQGPRSGRAFMGHAASLGGALIAFALLHAFFNDSIDFNMRRYDHVLVSTAQALLGIYLSFGLVMLLACAGRGVARVQGVLAYLGAGSLFILMLHNVIQIRAYVLLWRLSSGHEAFAGVCGFVLGVALPLVAWETVRGSAWLSRIFLARGGAPASGGPHGASAQEG